MQDAKIFQSVISPKGDKNPGNGAYLSVAVTAVQVISSHYIALGWLDTSFFQSTVVQCQACLLVFETREEKRCGENVVAMHSGPLIALWRHHARHVHGWMWCLYRAWCDAVRVIPKKATMVGKY